jgi:hypothetical protein
MFVKTWLDGVYEYARNDWFVWFIALWNRHVLAYIARWDLQTSRRLGALRRGSVFVLRKCCLGRYVEGRFSCYANAVWARTQKVNRTGFINLRLSKVDCLVHYVHSGISYRLQTGRLSAYLKMPVGRLGKSTRLETGIDDHACSQLPSLRDYGYSF